MARRILFYTLAAAMALSAADAAEPPRVSSLTIEGNRFFSDSELRRVMTMKPKRFRKVRYQRAALLSDLLLGVAWRAGLGLALLGVLDLLVSKWLYRHRLKMSQQEIRDEAKETEGRPEVKAQRRRRQLEASRSRSVLRVREADVVVTNPTHFAVALCYRRASMRAPQVVAKGRNKAAERIRKEAREHGVPLVENPPLARELYRKVEVLAEIPPELYLAVAEVIAFVMRLGAELAPAPAQAAAAARQAPTPEAGP